MEGGLRFPNLVWAIREVGLAHYQVAMRIGMEPSRFSRCMTGRFEFRAQERHRISELLRMDESWLFSRPTPRRLATKGEAQNYPFAPSTAR
jgi:hypothetical protein